MERFAERKERRRGGACGLVLKRSLPERMQRRSGTARPPQATNIADPWRLSKAHRATSEVLRPPRSTTKSPTTAACRTTALAIFAVVTHPTVPDAPSRRKWRGARGQASREPLLTDPEFDVSKWIRRL